MICARDATPRRRGLRLFAQRSRKRPRGAVGFSKTVGTVRMLEVKKVKITHFNVFECISKHPIKYSRCT